MLVDHTRRCQHPTGRAAKARMLVSVTGRMTPQHASSRVGQWLKTTLRTLTDQYEGLAVHGDALPAGVVLLSHSSR